MHPRACTGDTVFAGRRVVTPYKLMHHRTPP